MNEVNTNHKSKVLTIVITKGPYISESAEMGLKTALKAKRKGYEVNVFLFLDGTWISHLTSDKNFNNCGDWLKRVIRKGINVKMCDRCSKARDLTQCTIIDGIEIPGTYQFIDLLKKSDKVLTFGG